MCEVKKSRTYVTLMYLYFCSVRRYFIVIMGLVKVGFAVCFPCTKNTTLLFKYSTELFLIINLYRQQCYVLKFVSR